jgi:hypothetical protein
MIQKQQQQILQCIRLSRTTALRRTPVCLRSRNQPQQSQPELPNLTPMMMVYMVMSIQGPSQREKHLLLLMMLLLLLDMTSTLMHRKLQLQLMVLRLKMTQAMVKIITEHNLAALHSRTNNRRWE